MASLPFVLDLALLLFALWTLRRAICAAGRLLLTRGPYRVVRVIDGDTLDVARPSASDEDAFRVRILGIDAPETSLRSEKLREDAATLGETPEEHARRGAAAAGALERLVAGRLVELHYEPVRWRGHYGRALARVWVLGEDGHQRLFEAGQRLYEDGFARRAV